MESLISYIDMYIEFGILREALPNLLEFLGLNFSGAKKKNPLSCRFLVLRTYSINFVQALQLTYLLVFWEEFKTLQNLIYKNVILPDKILDCRKTILVNLK